MIKYGHVGWIDEPEDKMRLPQIFTWLMAHAPDLTEDEIHFDAIDLNNGRDFLLEREKYDVVVLHYLFKGFSIPFDGMEAFLKAHEGRDRFKESPVHCSELFAQRIRNTECRYAFVFGHSSEVSVQYIGEIPGYKLYHEPFGGVYENIGACSACGLSQTHSRHTDYIPGMPEKDYLPHRFRLEKEWVK